LKNGLEYQIEYRIVKSDGSVRWMMGSGAPRLDMSGHVTGFIGTIVDVSEQHTARLKNLSSQDALTGLPNRQLIQERLRQRLTDPRGEMPQAILFLDLDQFKRFNEGLGREFGDLLLMEVANRLQHTVRENDLVSRLGSDEFVIIAECRNGSTSANRIARKVLDAVARPMTILGREVHVTASLGISLFPQDGESCEQLFQSADIALHSAKAARSLGVEFRFYTADMSLQSKTRLLLLSALRKALDNQEFSLHYQPRVELHSLEVVGMEALLRWHHPELGNIPPSQFIPLAEEAGLIESIGEWVLKRATKQAQLWTSLHKRPFRMSVNVSARQLRSTRLLQTIENALLESGLPAEQLEIELTESALMEDTELAVTVLSSLRDRGIHLSVDDFGTGYSSLAYLAKFPLDGLKLDRSFLQHRAEDVNPRKLAKAIINLAHTLNLSVVAEGVETREHLGFLRGASCDEIQGFCISVPLPPSEFEAFIQEERTSFRFDDEKLVKNQANR
jgi:diguanylate cyclase (GGDEF)-like protein